MTPFRLETLLSTIKEVLAKAERQLESTAGSKEACTEHEAGRRGEG